MGMKTFTIKIEAGNFDGTIWQALHPAETIQSNDDPDEIARDVAMNQTIAEDGHWRVAVWEGEDPYGEPDGVYEQIHSLMEARD